MSYKQIKWLILLIPTLTIGLWEYVRHEFLLPYISMELGNLLAPMIVFVVTMIFVLKLMNFLEKMKEDLEEEKAQKAILQEKEKLSRVLHDGISQSLFLAAVKFNQLELKERQLIESDSYQKVKKILKHIHEDVRQAIFNLRNEESQLTFHWTNSISALISTFKNDTKLEIHFNWELEENQLSDKEKTELYACIKEALMNIRKHAQCQTVSIVGIKNTTGWTCIIEDDGIGFNSNNLEKGYGIQIMKDRSDAMNWLFKIERIHNKTKLTIKKGE